MSLSDSDYQILELTDVFYAQYPNPPYTEILKKKKRAYHFKNTHRSQKHRSGLDYTKIIIIKNKEFLDSKDALIDKDEFNETVKNLNKIKRQALRFVQDYIDHISGKRLLHLKEFKRRYQYSTLQYFHKELLESL